MPFWHKILNFFIVIVYALFWEFCWGWRGGGGILKEYQLTVLRFRFKLNKCVHSSQKVFLEFAFIRSPSSLLPNSVLFLPQNADCFISSVWRFPKSPLGRSSNIVCPFLCTENLHLHIIYVWTDIYFLRNIVVLNYDRHPPNFFKRKEQKMFCLVKTFWQVAWEFPAHQLLGAEWKC